MENNTILDIKRIVGDNSYAGIYGVGTKMSVKLVDTYGNVISALELEKKIQILSIILDKMINEGLTKELWEIQFIFYNLLDKRNSVLEASINELFKKVMFLYSKPQIDIKEILLISDLVSNRLNKELYDNVYVKEELQKRIRYV